MKYFLIQSAASTILLLGFMTKEIRIRIKIIIMICSTVISIALFIKVAVAPFHTWLPPIANKISWDNLALLLTWQKITPLFILIKNITWKSLIVFRIISILIGVISQFNITSSKLIIALSSISHMGWILISILSNNNIPLVYLLIYRTISIAIIINFKKANITILTQQIDKKNITTISILILSLAGIPPLIGFIPKWIVLTNTQQKIKSIIILSIIVVIASIRFFIYIRLIIRPIVNQNRNITIKPNKTNTNKFFRYINLAMPTLLIFHPK